MIKVRLRGRNAIVEDGCGLFEGDLMLAKVRTCFTGIPTNPRYRCALLHCGLHADGEGLGAGLVGGIGAAAAPALEAALEQAHQAGVPVADDEEDEERRGEEVVIGEAVDDREEEVGAE